MQFFPWIPMENDHPQPSFVDFKVEEVEILPKDSGFFSTSNPGAGFKYQPEV